MAMSHSVAWAAGGTIAVKHERQLAAAHGTKKTRPQVCLDACMRHQACTRWTFKEIWRPRVNAYSGSCFLKQGASLRLEVCAPPRFRNCSSGVIAARTGRDEHEAPRYRSTPLLSPAALVDAAGRTESELDARLLAASRFGHGGDPSKEADGFDGPPPASESSDFAARFVARLRAGVAGSSTATSASRDEPRVAIATLHYGASSGACGVVKWCYSAAHLAGALGRRAEVVVISEDEHSVESSCWPRARLVLFDPPLLRLAQKWAAARASDASSQNNGHADGGTFSATQLMKWQLTSLVEYSAILYLDTDIDLFLHGAGRPPHPSSTAGVAVARVWRAALNAFLQSGTELLASADPHVPINGGAFLIRPSHELHTLGVAALAATSRFNYTHGFLLRGPPRAALNPSPNANISIAWSALPPPLLRSRMWRRDTWNVVDGDGDQGLLAHVFLGVRGGRTLSYTTKHASWRVHHFFSVHKPWGKHARCLAYFDFMRQPDFQLARSTWQLNSSLATKCLRRFAQKRTCLVPRTARDCQRCVASRDKSMCHVGAAPNCPRTTRWWLL